MLGIMDEEWLISLLATAIIPISIRHGEKKQIISCAGRYNPPEDDPSFYNR